MVLFTNSQFLHWSWWFEFYLVFVNSLWPSEVKWWLRFGSTLFQVMAWCLMAPSHYLHQCWHSSMKSCGNCLRAISLEMVKTSILDTSLKITKSILQLHFPGTSELSIFDIDGLVQEKHNSIANALQLHLSCSNPSIWVSKWLNQDYSHISQWPMSQTPQSYLEWHCYCEPD